MLIENHTALCNEWVFLKQVFCLIQRQISLSSTYRRLWSANIHRHAISPLYNGQCT